MYATICDMNYYEFQSIFIYLHITRASSSFDILNFSNLNNCITMWRVCMNYKADLVILHGVQVYWGKLLPFTKKKSSVKYYTLYELYLDVKSLYELYNKLGYIARSASLLRKIRFGIQSYYHSYQLNTIYQAFSISSFSY